MSDDVLFGRVMMAGMAAVLAVALPYRIKSWAPRERLDRRQEGVFILATLRPIAAAMWLAVFAFMINPAWLAWSSVPLPAGVRWGGAVLGALAAVTLYWTLSTLGPNLTDTVVTRRDHTLVTRGPYRWIRHPFYGSVTLLVAAVTLLSSNWFVLLMGTLVIGLLVVRTRKEEENLVARFGEEYRDYMARTGRFFPLL